MKLYQLLAQTVDAYRRCIETDNNEWKLKHHAMLGELSQYLPSGSGFDNGSCCTDDSRPDKLVLWTSFHHMDEYGSYDGWTEHTVTVKPSLVHRFELSISGRNRNDIKEYIHQAFYEALNQEMVADHDAGTYKLAA